MPGNPRGRLVRGAAIAALCLFDLAGTARAADPVYEFHIPPEPLGKGLTDYSKTASQQIVFSEALTDGKTTRGVDGRYTAADALGLLLAGTGLEAQTSAAGVLMVQPQIRQAPRLAVPPPKPLPDPLSELETVVVSGTRITNSNFDAPTPAFALGEKEIQQSAHPNIFDTIAQLPALMGSRGSAIGNGNNSNGLNGMSVFSIRGLGPIRTLTLVDGQRIAPGNINGTADVGLLPQLLIQRVDVVTGGASASWGSDAVAGVINIITIKDFSGLKANLEGGITNYGDDASLLAQATWGRGFLDDRLHVTLAGEYYRNGGVPARAAGVNGGPNGRSWFQEPVVATRTIAATPAGQPEYQLFAPGQNNTYSYGGLIVGGPLKGTAFGPGGTPYLFQYGVGCIGNFCQGGENSANVLVTAGFDARTRRVTGFGRLSYDLTPDINLFTTLSYAEAKSIAQVNQGAAQQGNLIIQCDNAFLPASIKSACAANKITNFAYGVSNLIFPQSPGVEITRKQPRFVLGLDAGNVMLLGAPWSLNAYVQHGETHVDVDIHNVILIPRYKAAIDAVTGANGQIVCRDPVAAASGCQPFNIIGINPVSAAAWAYIAPQNGPFQGSSERQEVVSFALSGTPWRNWAGDISVAVGAEWRQEAYHATADWYGGGLNALSTVNARYPADPILTTTGVNWYAGSFFNGSGAYEVSEGFAEIGMKLFDNGMGKFDLDLAGRYTDYSTSGPVETWKVGGVWDTPVPGLRLKAVASRDVRAPNLSELYPAPLSTNATVTDRITGNLVNVSGITFGNPALNPEKSDNFEAGLVWRPAWLTGFQLSADYYEVKIDNGIAAPQPQQVVDLCQVSGNADSCANIKLNGTLGTSDPPYVNTRPVNLAVIYTSGIDVAAGFSAAPDSFGIPGTFNVMAQAAHVNSFILNLGLPNSAVLHAAGENTNPRGGYGDGDIAITPKWKGLISESWSWDRYSLSVSERLVSHGFINPDYIQCQPGTCPLATIQHPTIDNNQMPGAVYLDVGGAMDLPAATQIYFKIDNLADVSPPPYGQPGVYDWLGRMYRLGLRVTID